MPEFDLSARRMFEGNLLMIVCCGFYLAWWLLAFRPAGAVRGMKTAWLLLPAFTAGLAAVVLIVRGIAAAEVKSPLFPDGWVLWGGIAVYAVLLAVTLLVFHRPVTTELFLIVGWAMLTLSEISTLYGTGRFSRGSAMGFTAVTAAAALVSLVCYVLYYNLKGTAGYYDGAVPLAAAAVVMAGLCAAMAL